MSHVFVSHLFVSHLFVSHLFVSHYLCLIYLFLFLCLWVCAGLRVGAAQPAVARLLTGGPLRRQACSGLRICAQVIVEVKKHCRTFRRGTNQISGLPQSVRLDHVAFVSRQVIAVLAFPRIHIEVIEPKIVQNLLQLTFRVRSVCASVLLIDAFTSANAH